MKLQTKKKQLAGLLMAPHDGANANDNLGALHVSAIEWTFCLAQYTNINPEPEIFAVEKMSANRSCRLSTTYTVCSAL